MNAAPKPVRGPDSSDDHPTVAPDDSGGLAIVRLDQEVRAHVTAVASLVAFVVVAVLLAAAFGANLLGWARRSGGPPDPWSSPAPLLPASLGLLALTRWRSLSEAQLRRATTVYQYFGAVVLAVAAHGGASVEASRPGFFSWLAVWILLFPLVIPRSTRRNVADALVCASMAPLTQVCGALLRGAPVPGSRSLFDDGHAYFACALLAVGPAVVVRRIRERVDHERARRQKLGSYRLTRRLSRGGMGEVWVADHQLLVRPAAVKLIRRGTLNVSSWQEHERAMRRFEREAQKTASLTSPHTVTLYDFGRTPDGSFYCAMELLEGWNLEDLVESEGAQPAARVAHLLRQACDSLAEAHAQGLVHRDIKPANLFVCRQGLTYDFLKVLDFGLVTSGEEQGAERLSGVGKVVGTPLCMAPEQISGEEVDGRTDLYGLGCVGYWLLTGRYPFTGKTALEVIAAHAKERPRRLREQPGAESVHPGLEALVLACLEKSREARPRSAEDLRRRLDALDDVGPWTQDAAEGYWHRQQLAATPEEGGQPAGESTLLLPSRLAPSGRQRG